MVTPKTWKEVFNTKLDRWYFTLYDAAKVAGECGYKFMVFNDHIYNVCDVNEDYEPRDTGLTIKDLG